MAAILRSTSGENGLSSADTTALHNMRAKLKELENTCRTKEEKHHFSTEMEGFLKLFTEFLAVRKRKNVIDWSKIKPPAEGTVLEHAQLPACLDAEAARLLSKLAVLKLNGGLGTTMGCTGPKSAIEVRSEATFLDITVQQVEALNSKYGVSVPLILMNSFNTHEQTLKIIEKYKGSSLKILTFNQSRYPRILKDTLTPMPGSYYDDPTHWFPPGHADVFESLRNSGFLKKLQEQGVEYVFISNVDNLGATVDLNILHHLVESKAEFIMELTDKTKADVKGGTLIEYEGKAKLLEIAQVPGDKVEEFKSIKKFKIFNTNNLWVSLPAIDRLLDENAFQSMDLIINPKVEKGKGVVQLERAAGAAIQYFKGSHGVNVPRTRFLPVKSTSDLFVIQSNLYSMEEGNLILNPMKAFPTVPNVKLGDEFKKVSDYMRRFESIPDLLDLDHLTVSGDVTFGKNVTLRGTVIIVANHGSRIDIPSGTVLENKIVSGNLRILDH
eukprot:TRINITY_DN3047_c0_g1_i2.p1 TRINITY_DN3047_c0_g1~~TRINITY_DN3047_c0_g1_i2.p1  ORF type:complete len:497 (+),score=107.88 TRINITY_DN3047_c0_g1_i2:102-1592(+)